MRKEEEISEREHGKNPITSPLAYSIDGKGKRLEG